MATIRIPDENRTLHDADAIGTFLLDRGIQYERWRPDVDLSPDDSADAVLAAYAPKIDELKARGGYVSVDVIDVTAQTAGLEAMLAKFSSEHWHDEDEVRLIVEGRGIFHIHPPGQTVFAIEVEGGDLIRVPKGTHHWFDLCAERRIRAVRLFQSTAGWTPHYTQSGVDRNFQPVCFGPAYFPPIHATA